MPVALGRGSHERFGRVLEEEYEMTTTTTSWRSPQGHEVTRG
jgi:hypothetical protein